MTFWDRWSHSFMLYVMYYSETNLKVKQALTVTAELGEDLQKLTDFNGEFMSKFVFSKNFLKHWSPWIARASPFQATSCTALLWMWWQANRMGTLHLYSK